MSESYVKVMEDRVGLSEREAVYCSNLPLFALHFLTVWPALQIHLDFHCLETNLPPSNGPNPQIFCKFVIDIDVYSSEVICFVCVCVIMCRLEQRVWCFPTLPRSSQPIF